MAQSALKTNQDYFEQLFRGLKNPELYSAKGNMLTNQVSRKMQRNIKSSEVTLPQELGTKNLIIPKKIQVPAPQSQENLLKKVEHEKVTLLQKMKQLTKQQDDLKNKIKANSSRQKIIFKSQLTQEDKQRIKQLVRQKRQFQKSLDDKNKQLKDLYRQRTLQQMKRQQQIFQQKKQQKRLQILENLKSLQLRSAQRKQEIEDSKYKIKQINDQKYLYLKYLERQQMTKYQKQEQYLKKVQEIKNKSKLNIQEIKQHERKYEQLLQKSQLKFQQKSMQLIKNRRSKSFADNYFSVMIKAKMQEQKIQQYQRLNQAHVFKQRISKFQQKLNSDYKPKISNKSKFTPVKQVQSVQSLSSVQQRQKGIEYLQKSKKLKDLEKQKQRRMTLASPQIKNQYKDYTKQLKYKAYQTAQRKFNSLVRQKSSLNNFESAATAVQLASQIQAKSKLSTDKKLLNSVRNKIELLNALQ